MTRYLVVIGIILVVLYFTGVLKKIPIIRDLPFFGDLELTDNCFRKNCEGSYDLSILFETSSNRSFAKQKMELFYSIKILKKDCSIRGTGYKSGEQITDTLTQEKIRRDYLENKFPITTIGTISNDTLYLEISKNTNSNADHKVNLKFPFTENEIHLLRGVFTEDLTNSSGKAKLQRK